MFIFEEKKSEPGDGKKKLVVSRSRKVVQKSGPETRDAIIQLIADNANITSRDMANKLNINRSAILKHLKKLQEENLVAREGSQKSGRWIILRK